MTIELPNNNEMPLVLFFEKLSEEEKDSIDKDILNARGLSTAIFEKISDTETARGIMGRFRQYIEWKESKKMSRADLKNEAKEITDLIERAVE